MNPDEIKTSDEFDTAIGDKLCPASSAEYFESDPEKFAPNLNWYEYDEEHQTHMPEVDEITPEAMKDYIGAEIMVSIGDIVDRGSVRLKKRDVGVNTIGRYNSNTIIETRAYEV